MWSRQRINGLQSKCGLLFCRDQVPMWSRLGPDGRHVVKNESTQHQINQVWVNTMRPKKANYWNQNSANWVFAILLSHLQYSHLENKLYLDFIGRSWWLCLRQKSKMKLDSSKVHKHSYNLCLLNWYKHWRGWSQWRGLLMQTRFCLHRVLAYVDVRTRVVGGYSPHGHSFWTKPTLGI